MKFRLAAAFAALGLSACQPSTAPATEVNGIAALPADGQPPPDTPVATANAAEAGCAAKAETMWGPIGPSDHPSYHVEAWTSGGPCESGVVTLAIRARDGFPLYAWASAVQYVFGLKDAKDLPGMNKALAEWIDRGPTPDTTATLPEWETTEGQPKRAEFPFMPPEGYDKAAWDDMRKANLHMFCFPQGSESSQCLVLHPADGGAPAMMEEIGVQLFPG